MKMARASEQDLECAQQVASFLESLIKGYLPDCITEDEDEIEWFRLDDHDQCKRVLEKLIEVAQQGSMFRVTFGMEVLLDPRNELLDPAADTLEIHPALAQLLNNTAMTP
ncbi:hypothetical protein E8F20_06005 [Pseudomonas sp. BN415]|uniref:hypothetical protein n=1 Tax=Pseudomonas sp. BN415 TaxID=2567889 RepID=UPI0024572F52|nr:hypothetical protein [Pseudomonas sp. BN415]MDH4581429.1 hypothetical protein [Pseudomonas sp. BN415]